MGDQERFPGVHEGKFGTRRQYQFRLVGLTCGALGTDQNSTPHSIIRRKVKERPSCPWYKGVNLDLFLGRRDKSRNQARLAAKKGGNIWSIF